MKRCSCCREAKPLSEFHRNRSTGDGYAGLCKRCQTTKKLQVRANDRAELFALYGSACSGCGNSDRRVLELDHVDGGGTAERNADIRRGIHDRQFIEHVRANLERYQLLCANCHRIKTWEERERRNGPVPEPQTPEQRRAQKSANLSANIKRYWDGLTPAERSERSRRAMASLTPEQLTDKARRAAATVRANGGRRQRDKRAS